MAVVCEYQLMQSVVVFRKITINMNISKRLSSVRSRRNLRKPLIFFTSRTIRGYLLRSSFF
jgi:hypothetical protein